MIEPMRLECPRCLLSNPDAAQFCECGYDFTPHFQELQLKPDRRPSKKRWLFSDEMSRGGFLFGILLIWLALAVGELYRIRIELPRRPKMELALSSLMVGMTDLAAALVVAQSAGLAYGLHWRRRANVMAASARSARPFSSRWSPLRYYSSSERPSRPC